MKSEQLFGYFPDAPFRRKDKAYVIPYRVSSPAFINVERFPKHDQDKKNPAENGKGGHPPRTYFLTPLTTTKDPSPCPLFTGSTDSI